MTFLTFWSYDAVFPPLLREIPSAPRALFVRGDPAVLDTPCVAVVGTRRNTTYGQQQTLRFTRAIAEAGYTVVSGLAYGIDAIAHEAALDAGGPTIAVLGNGIDAIHPRGNEALARRILANGGAVVSEYPPGTPAHAGHFPARNRLVSGLSLATLVVEAPIKSGALITARRAFEQNREVAALPGDLSRETFEGNHRLIADQTARLVRTPEEFLSLLPTKARPSFVKAPVARGDLLPTDETQRAVWISLGNTSKTLEELLRDTDRPASQVSVALTQLELLSRVRDLGRGRYIRGP